MARPTRFRQLTPGQQQRIAALRHMSRLLDSAYQVPGTTYRVGLDPIVACSIVAIGEVPE